MFAVSIYQKAYYYYCYYNYSARPPTATNTTIGLLLLRH